MLSEVEQKNCGRKAPPVLGMVAPSPFQTRYTKNCYHKTCSSATNSTQRIILLTAMCLCGGVLQANVTVQCIAAIPRCLYEMFSVHVEWSSVLDVASLLIHQQDAMLPQGGGRPRPWKINASKRARRVHRSVTRRMSCGWRRTHDRARNAKYQSRSFMVVTI